MQSVASIGESATSYKCDKTFFFNLEKAYKGQISICNQMQTLGNLWLVSAGNDGQNLQ